MARVLIVDNFDSFTHNLAQVLGGLGAEVLVRRNTARVEELLALRPDAAVLSPGPGGPDETGACLAFLRVAAGALPVLGVCLGMQVMASAFGARVCRAAVPVHGKSAIVTHDGRGVFRGLPARVTVGRYHSLVVDVRTLPPALVPSAWSGDGELMGLRHATMPMEAVQFHPESVLTPLGGAMLASFLALTPSAGR